MSDCDVHNCQGFQLFLTIRKAVVCIVMAHRKKKYLAREQDAPTALPPNKNNELGYLANVFFNQF